jgi:hypothetical protein
VGQCQGAFQGVEVKNILVPKTTVFQAGSFFRSDACACGYYQVVLVKVVTVLKVYGIGFGINTGYSFEQAFNAAGKEVCAWFDHIFALIDTKGNKKIAGLVVVLPCFIDYGDFPLTDGEVFPQSVGHDCAGGSGS